MNKNDDFIPWMKIFFGGGITILLLLVILFLLAYLVNGQALPFSQLKELFVILFRISIGIFGGLLVFMFMAALITAKKNPAVPVSMVVRDNFLKYEYEEGGKKKKKTFSLNTISAYLKKWKKMDLIHGYTLTMEDTLKKPNIRTLLVESKQIKKESLAVVYNNDPDEYNRIAAFLDRMSQKDLNLLHDRLQEYIRQEEFIEDGDRLKKQLNRFDTQEADIQEDIGKAMEQIDLSQSIIRNSGYSSKYRKLYSYYVPMLIEILTNYETLKKHDSMTDRSVQAKQKVKDVFAMIISAFESLQNQDDENPLDELEAVSQNINELLKKKAE